jgi:thiol-disulfide isomerase/thioredoxin
MASKKSKKMPPIMDVSNEGQLAALEELRKKHIIILVNVYADWCGHCHTYKPMLEEFAQIPGRKMPIARINEKVLAKSPAAKAKLKGFPTNVLLGRDGSFAEFNDEEGEPTHAVPNMRDKKAMKVLLLSDPSKLTENKGVGSPKLSEKTYSNDSTPTPTERAENLLVESGKKAVKNKDLPIRTMERPMRPKSEEDTAKEAAAPYVHSPLLKNGSLFKSLEQILKEEEGAAAPTKGGGIGKKTRVNRRKNRTTAKRR